MQLIDGNCIDLLTCGTEYFPSLLVAIDEAIAEIRLETYIFESDATGKSIAAALIRAAQRGVVVHVLVDGFGSPRFMSDLGLFMRAAGVNVLVYRPEISRFKLRRHRLRRLHRKLVVIDARIAFVGGINIIDDTNTPGQIPPRHDYALRIEGPLLTPIYASVQKLSHLIGWVYLRRRPHQSSCLRPIAPSCGNISASFVVRDNLRHRHDIESAYLEAICTAQNEVIIACAYFLPGRRFRHALIQAAQRGVKVVLLLQGRVEYTLLHYASQAIYGQLLDAGVDIHEYQAGFLHAKVAVIDHHWVTVGSSNIDPFSLLLAREANVVICHDDFAMQLRDSLYRVLIGSSQAIENHHWKTERRVHRAASWFAYTMVRLAIGLAGYGDQH